MRVELSTSSEVVAVDIYAAVELTRMVCCYVSPSGPSETRTQRIIKNCATVSTYSSVDHAVVITGDFNLPSIDWTNPSSHVRGDNMESQFVECCNMNGLEQLISLPTHKDGAILDLLLTSDPDLICEMYLFPPPFPSDHMAIAFDLRLQSELSKQHPKKLSFREMNEGQIAAHLDAIHWPTFFLGCNDLESAYERFTDCCNFLIQKFVPCSREKRNPCRIRSFIERQRWTMNSTEGEITAGNMTESSTKISRAARRLRILQEASVNPNDAKGELEAWGPLLGAGIEGWESHAYFSQSESGTSGEVLRISIQGHINRREDEASPDARGSLSGPSATDNRTGRVYNPYGSQGVRLHHPGWDPSIVLQAVCLVSDRTPVHHPLKII